MLSITSALFVDEFRSLPPRTLPAAGLSLSRWILDDWLAREFSRLGGELKSGVRWIGTYGAGIVNATGRRPEPASNGSRLFGLKVHAHALPMSADLEMHFGKSGYIGLCRLAGGAVNVCGLFRTDAPVPDLARRWREFLGARPIPPSINASPGRDSTSNPSVAWPGSALRPTARSTDRNAVSATPSP